MSYGWKTVTKVYQREPLPIKVKMEAGSGYTPTYAHSGDAGMDLRAVDWYTIAPGESAMVRTGLHVQIPNGYVGLVFPRSGLGSKGITLRNAVGVVDSGYRGQVLAALWNTTSEPFEVSRGDRVCQLVIMPYARCEVEKVDELDDTERGEGGYGSTGVK